MSTKLSGPPMTSSGGYPGLKTPDRIKADDLIEAVWHEAYSEASLDWMPAHAHVETLKSRVFVDDRSYGHCF